jgi:hypothetical protein
MSTSSRPFHLQRVHRLFLAVEQASSSGTLDASLLLPAIDEIVTQSPPPASIGSKTFLEWHEAWIECWSVLLRKHFPHPIPNHATPTTTLFSTEGEWATFEKATILWHQPLYEKGRFAYCFTPEASNVDRLHSDAIVSLVGAERWHLTKGGLELQNSLSRVMASYRWIPKSKERIGLLSDAEVLALAFSYEPPLKGRVNLTHSVLDQSPRFLDLPPLSMMLFSHQLVEKHQANHKQTLAASFLNRVTLLIPPVQPIRAHEGWACDYAYQIDSFAPERSLARFQDYSKTHPGEWPKPLLARFWGHVNQKDSFSDPVELHAFDSCLLTHVELHDSEYFRRWLITQPHECLNWVLSCGRHLSDVTRLLKQDGDPLESFNFLDTALLNLFSCRHSSDFDVQQYTSHPFFRDQTFFQRHQTFFEDALVDLFNSTEPFHRHRFNLHALSSTHVSSLVRHALGNSDLLPAFEALCEFGEDSYHYDPLLSTRIEERCRLLFHSRNLTATPRSRVAL